MKRMGIIIAAVLSLIVLAACSDGKIIYERRTGESTESSASWTVLVYMCGGNEETESGAYSDKLRQMMKVDYPENINVVVQTGGSSQWHMDGIYSEYLQRFEMGRGSMYLADQSTAANMGNYRTLEDFLTWGTSTYKSDNYMLILSGEGGSSIYGMGYDEMNENDGLNLEEISYAMSLSGVNFDIVGLDTSLMGSLETATALSTYAKYMVASQDIQPADGWDYEGFIKYICENPLSDTEDIGIEMCNTYYSKSLKNGTAADAAMSVTDMSKISSLNQTFDGMIGDILPSTESISEYTNVSKIMDSVHIYGGASVDEGFSNSIDIGDMAMKMSGYATNTSDVLINTLNDTVIYRVCGEREANSAGLSVYYPINADSEELQTYMQFAPGVRYKEFLRKTCIDCYTEDDSADYTSSNAWAEYTSDMEALEYMSILDGNSYELNIIGNMDMFKDISINVYKADKGGNYVLLGQYDRLDADWEAGIFKDGFDGMMLRLCGKNVTARRIRSYEDYDLYAVPALVNGKRSSIHIARYKDNKYEVICVWPCIENGRVNGSIRKLGFFDRIAPVLSVYYEEHNQTEYITDSFTFKLARGAGDGNIENGSYIFEYELTDAYGKKRRGTPVNGSASGGRIIFK